MFWIRATITLLLLINVFMMIAFRRYQMMSRMVSTDQWCVVLYSRSFTSRKAPNPDFELIDFVVLAGDLFRPSTPIRLAEFRWNGVDTRDGLEHFSYWGLDCPYGLVCGFIL